MFFFSLPTGKKCTYGHKCKFYHPERGSQPQRAVADELRASAKTSSVASRGLLEHALMVKSQSADQSEGMVEGAGSKQPVHFPQTAFAELMEDRLRVHSKVEGRRGSNSSSSSSCSGSTVGHPAPGGPPSSGRLDRWELPGGSAGARVLGSSQAETYHRCESPEVGYSSLIKSYSSLSLVVPQTPECLFPADLRAGSLLSDCSSEGSVSSDSFSPDPVLDDSPKCHHHHHHHYSGQYTHLPSRVSPGLGQRSPHGYSVPQGLRRQLGFGAEDLPSSVASQASPHSFQTPPAYVSHQHQHPLLASFPGELQPRPPPPIPTTTRPQSQSSALSHNLMGSLWQDCGLQDSRMYKDSPLHSRNYSALNQQPQPQANWDPNYQHSPKPSYDLFSYKSLPGVHGKPWHSLWGQPVHSSPRGLSASSLPTHPQQSRLPPAPQHQEPPGLGRYQDLREQVFVNLCGIFPPDLVRMVMNRNPHVMDAQELAAAILLEKLQHGS